MMTDGAVEMALSGRGEALPDGIRAGGGGGEPGSIIGS